MEDVVIDFTGHTCHCAVYRDDSAHIFIFPEINEGKMTVGKIYVGLLIAENWKAYKASQSSSFGLKIVSAYHALLFHSDKIR